MSNTPLILALLTLLIAAPVRIMFAYPQVAALVTIKQPIPKNSYEHRDQALAQIVDVERSVRFCQAWKLTPSEGPHLVITSTYPDESHLSTGLPKDSAVYKLGDMAPPDISALLSKLTDELIASGKVANPAGASTPAPPAKLWVQLLTATQQMINTFGCAWSFKINAGPVSADLKSCKTR
jgi:hypothetical protein